MQAHVSYGWTIGKPSLIMLLHLTWMSFTLELATTSPAMVKMIPLCILMLFKFQFYFG